MLKIHQKPSPQVHHTPVECGMCGRGRTSRSLSADRVAGRHPRLVRQQAELAPQTQVIDLVPVGDDLAVTQMLNL